MSAEAMSSTDSPRSRRLLWWGMLGACGVLSCGLALIVGMTWYRGQVQKSRIEALLQLEGVTIYGRYGEYVYTPRGRDAGVVAGAWSPFSTEDDPPTRLKWLVPILGEHCFVYITKIEIGDGRFSDADVPLLLGFPELRELEIWMPGRLTDQGIRQLADLKRLVVLDAYDIPLSADTIGRFADCSELRELRIATKRSNSAAMSHLQRAVPGCQIDVFDPDTGQWLER